ncbi:hypothetical protein AOQ84DRAFT_365374 [Glonium stellatum]|uniref:Uncharacterized protein n=1 Tax=Glonium stellatum TaxID=574774 RepID=A0A8E2EXX9_9PEZI|nr:hypothetical protein AOQ84DRAFT_365374 [Glonium stellatum]
MAVQPSHPANTPSSSPKTSHHPNSTLSHTTTPLSSPPDPRVSPSCGHACGQRCRCRAPLLLPRTTALEERRGGGFYFAVFDEDEGGEGEEGEVEGDLVDCLCEALLVWLGGGKEAGLDGAAGVRKVV